MGRTVKVRCNPDDTPANPKKLNETAKHLLWGDM